jgi:hypothetical protein
VDAARQLAQLGGGLVQLVQRGIQELDRLCGVVLDPVPGQAQVDAQRHQPLLGAVVQVALDAAALLVAGLHDAGPRGAQLRDPDLQLGVETLALRVSVTAAPTACTRSASSSSEAPWMTAATGSPPWLILVATCRFPVREGPPGGRRTPRTRRSRGPSRPVQPGSPSAWASVSRSTDPSGVGAELADDQAHGLRLAQP